MQGQNSVMPVAQNFFHGDARRLSTSAGFLHPRPMLCGRRRPPARCYVHGRHRRQKEWNSDEFSKHAAVTVIHIGPGFEALPALGSELPPLKSEPENFSISLTSTSAFCRPESSDQFFLESLSQAILELCGHKKRMAFEPTPWVNDGRCSVELRRDEDGPDSHD